MKLGLSPSVMPISSNGHERRVPIHRPRSDDRSMLGEDWADVLCAGSVHALVALKFVRQ